MGINTDYFHELEFGNDFVTNNPVETLCQTWYSFFCNQV